MQSAVSSGHDKPFSSTNLIIASGRHSVRQIQLGENYIFCMITEFLSPAWSTVCVGSVSCLGGKPVCNWYGRAAPGRDASMKDLMSPTVWLRLNRATMRVPSANLSCMDVKGCESSTTMPIDLGALRGSWVTGAGAGLSSAEDPPRVLPTPWKADRGLAAS